MSKLNIQQAYEIMLKKTNEVCSTGYEESNGYFVFTPDKYMVEGCLDSISYKVNKETGVVSEYTYLEYLEDTKKYNEDNWPVGVELTQPQSISRAS